VDIAPVPENRFKVAEATMNTRPGVGSALYDAISEAIAMTDAAPAEENAIRGVAVLAGSEATEGRSLDALAKMVTRDGRAVRQCRGFEADVRCLDEHGRDLTLHDVLGTDLAIPTQHPIKVFYIAASPRANPQLGCLLAEATRTDISSCTTTGDLRADLAKVLAQYGDYF
jgi:hypothetical protein